MALLCSSSFHLLSIQTRETLTNTLPMIYLAVSKERRVRSSIDRSLPHSLSLPILILLSSLSVHRFLPFSIAVNTAKDGNIDKTACRRRRRRRLDNVIYMYAIVNEEKRDPSVNITAMGDKSIIIPAISISMIKVFINTR